MLLSTLFAATQRVLNKLHLFAECSSNPHGRVLPLWDAEFGYILYQHVPLVYNLCRQKNIKKISICKGMSPFYYFIDPRMVDEHKCSFNQSPDLKKQHDVLKYNGIMPNYAPYYTDRIPPYFYIYNKHNREWGKDPINTLLPHDLKIIFDGLCSPAIYHRAENDKSLGTYDETHLSGDFEVAFSSNISTTKDILQHQGSRVMNALQIVLAKNARLVIGVQGGMAVMSSLIGARLLVLCKAGSECRRDYHFYPQTHNSTIIITENSDAIQRVLRHTCKKPSYFHASR